MKRGYIFLLLLILLLPSCAGATEAEFPDSIPKEFLTEEIPIYIELSKNGVDTSHASNFPKNDFTEEERACIWSLYLKQYASGKHEAEDAAYSALIYFYPGSVKTLLSVELYDDESAEFEKVAQLYEKPRDLGKTEEAVEAALQAAGDIWTEKWSDPANLDTIHRLWYDEVCSSPETLYEANWNNFLEGTDYSAENYIILYVDIDNVPDKIWEKDGVYTDYSIYLFRESVDAAWQWENFGPATVKAGECWDGRHVLVE